MIHHGASSQDTPSQGIPNGACSLSCPALPCVPLLVPALHSTTELGEGLNLFPVLRSLSKLCPYECFMFLFLFLFFNCLSLQGAKTTKKGKVTRSQDISKASLYKLYQFRLTRL